MKKAMLTVALASAIASPFALADAPQTEEQKLSYGLGYILGQRLSPDFDTLDFDMVKKGIEDVFSQAQPQMTQPEIQAAMQAFQMRKMEEQREQATALAGQNETEGAAFRETNAAKTGVTTTASGLQIEILEAGDGSQPTAEDSVKVHYRGTLIDGREFDSSYSRGEPVTFPLGGVIKGWTEGLQLMSKGAKARLVIPADLAYGPAGAGEMIGPNATLVFEVELLDINPEG